MAFTPEEAEQFYNHGRDIVTILASAIDDFEAWSRVFEIRGGKLAIDEASAQDDPQLGSNTEEIVVLRNNLRAFLDANNKQWQNVLDKYRTDF